MRENDDFSTNVGEGKVCARVTCNAKAVRFWSIQFGPYVEALEPKVLRDRVVEDIIGQIKYSVK